MISLSSMLLIKFVLVVCFLSIALISTTEATAHHVYLSAKSSPNSAAAAAANQIGSYESYKLKPNSYYKIELPSLRLPCKRYSCRFGNCENLIVNNVLNYTCHCVRGVAGPNCDLLDTEKLPCSSNPCYGGAKCFNYMDDYYCECPEGRDGKNCNSSTPDATDPCRTNPCGSQGICFTATNGYWCFCNDGKHGFSCNNAEERIITTRLCSSQDTCLNGGRCIPMNNSIICACKSNFYGPRCEFKLKSRNSAAAAIGDANSGSGSAMGSGSGLVGAVGAATSSRESCLTNVCLNNGSCAIKKGRVTCLCDTFYTGKFCESSVFVPCGKGSCNNLNGICIMDKCYCFRGYFGDKCQSDLKSLLSFSTNNKHKFDLSN